MAPSTHRSGNKNRTEEILHTVHKQWSKKDNDYCTIFQKDLIKLLVSNFKKSVEHVITTLSECYDIDINDVVSPVCTTSSTRTPNTPGSANIQSSNVLKIAFWNVRGLKKKKNEVEDFLKTRNIDVLLMQETFLKKDIEDPEITGYKLYRNDRVKQAQGGTAIYVKWNLDHSQLDTPQLKNIEATLITINTKSMGVVKIASVYSPPSKPILPEDMDLLFASNMSTIVAGDFNAKHKNWRSKDTTKKGRVLCKYAEDRNIQIKGPRCPTRFSSKSRKSSDVLDIALMKNIDNPTTITVDSIKISDHYPVIMEIGTNRRTRSKPIKYKDYV